MTKILLLACSFVAIEAASSSTAVQMQAAMLPHSMMRIMSIQVANVGYPGLPASVRAGLHEFSQIVEGKTNRLDKRLQAVEEGIKQDFVPGSPCVNAKILLYLATYALVVCEYNHAYLYAKTILSLQPGHFSPSDKVSAYLLIEELLSRDPRSCKRVLHPLLSSCERAIIELSKSCNQQDQDEFLYRLARKFYYEIPDDSDSAFRAAGCLGVLFKSCSVVGSLRHDVLVLLAIINPTLPKPEQPILPEPLPADCAVSEFDDAAVSAQAKEFFGLVEETASTHTCPERSAAKRIKRSGSLELEAVKRSRNT